MNFLLYFRCRKITSKSRANGKVVFNDCWPCDERFKLWLKKGQDCNKAVCSLYVILKLLTLQQWECVLSHHMLKKTKHQEKVRNFNPPCFSEEIKRVFPLLQVVLQNKVMVVRVDLMMNAVAVSHAEISWVMKVVPFCFSYCSCVNLNSLLILMFPDS